MGVETTASMEPSTRTPSIVVMALSLSTMAVFGCNALLDNRPADVNADLFATEPADDVDAARGAGRDVDASVPDPNDPVLGADPGPDDVADAGTDSLAPQCAAGTKSCGDACVSMADPAYGCAADTCGSCAPVHGEAACVAGQCALGACAAGWGDCNHVATDGCETDLSSPASCGACGMKCPAPAHATAACIAGACAAQCAAGFGDCNLKPADGCEAQLLKDKHNCGACGTVCLVGTCQNGTCVWNP